LQLGRNTSTASRDDWGAVALPAVTHAERELDRAADRPAFAVKRGAQNKPTASCKDFDDDSLLIRSADRPVFVSRRGAQNKPTASCKDFDDDAVSTGSADRPAVVLCRCAQNKPTAIREDFDDESPSTKFDDPPVSDSLLGIGNN